MNGRAARDLSRHERKLRRIRSSTVDTGLPPPELDAPLNAIADAVAALVPEARSQVETVKESLQSRRVRVGMLGAARRGKTTLLAALRGGESGGLLPLPEDVELVDQPELAWANGGREQLEEYLHSLDLAMFVCRPSPGVGEDELRLLRQAAEWGLGLIAVQTDCSSVGSQAELQNALAFNRRQVEEAGYVGARLWPVDALVGDPLGGGLQGLRETLAGAIWLDRRLWRLDFATRALEQVRQSVLEAVDSKLAESCKAADEAQREAHNAEAMLASFNQSRAVLLEQVHNESEAALAGLKTFTDRFFDRKEEETGFLLGVIRFFTGDERLKAWRPGFRAELRKAAKQVDDYRLSWLARCKELGCSVDKDDFGALWRLATDPVRARRGPGQKDEPSTEPVVVDPTGISNEERERCREEVWRFVGSIVELCTNEVAGFLASQRRVLDAQRGAVVRRTASCRDQVARLEQMKKQVDETYLVLSTALGREAARYWSRACKAHSRLGWPRTQLTVHPAKTAAARLRQIHVGRTVQAWVVWGTAALVAGAASAWWFLRP